MSRGDEIEPAVLTLQQAARYLRINAPELRGMLRSGEIQCYRSRGGKEWRVPRAACDRYIAEELAFFRSHREEFEPNADE